MTVDNDLQATAYLEHLWTQPPQDEQPDAILSTSKVISQAHERPTYMQLAAGHTAITTQNGGTQRSKMGTGHNSSSQARSQGNSLGLGNTIGVGTPALGRHDRQRQLDGVVASIEHRRAIYDAALLAANTASDLVRSMDEEIRSLEQEEAALSEAQPPAPERLRKVQRWLAERTAAVEAQRSVQETKQLALMLSEAELRAVEMELGFLADAREEAEALQKEKVAAKAEIAATLSGKEAKAAAGYQRVLEREAEKRADMEDQQEQRRQAVIKSAELGQEKAQERLTESTIRLKGMQSRGAAMLAAVDAKRQSAVLGLKDSLTAVRKDVAGKANLYRQLQKQRAEAREREFQDLLEQGLNPYEISRRKDNESQAAKERQKVHDNIAAKEIDIALRLGKEEEAYQRKLVAAAAQQLEVDKFNREMGVSSREARVEAYMAATTNGGITMLDPTGRLGQEPSLVTTMKTAAFGLGRASQDILQHIAERHPDVQPKELLLGKSLNGTASRGAISDGDDDSNSPPRSPAGGTAASWKVLATRPLSKHEQMLKEQAKARHKASIGRAKAMMGREFSSNAFIPTPAVVIFKDFEPGRTYTQKVAITNKSYNKNTYRVLDVPVEFGNVLQVDYALPGYLAAGVAGEVTVKFTPKANEDIETQINLLAETGPFSIAIKCLTKKALLSVQPAAIDIGGGGVTLGESVSRMLTISNQGALDVEFRVEAEEDGSAELMSSDSGAAAKLVGRGFTVGPICGSLGGYSQATVRVTFSPLAVEVASLPLRISYKSVAQRKLPIAPHHVSLCGLGRDVPVFVERSVVDLHCCSYGHTFRDFLHVQNGGKTAMKLHVVKRPELDGVFEFSPDFGFVQAGESFPISILFKPNKDTLEQCRRHVIDAEAGLLEVPMRIHVPDQKWPINFAIRAQVTCSDLVFDAPSLDFGPCVMAEQTGVCLRISNRSLLPQTFGFLGMPQGVAMSPNDGFGYVLPGETVERTVAFQPPIPGQQSFALTCKTLAGRTFTLPCHAKGVQPDLSLSHNKIRFAATPLDDTTSVSVVLRNNSDRLQAFEFAVPPNAELTFSPHVGEVAPQSTLRVQIDFAPRSDGSEEGTEDEEGEEGMEEDVGGGVGQAASRPSSRPTSGAYRHDGGGREIDEGDEEDEADDGDDQSSRAAYPRGTSPAAGITHTKPREWYRCAQHSIPCYIRPPPLVSNTTTSLSSTALSPSALGASGMALSHADSSRPAPSDATHTDGGSHAASAIDLSSGMDHGSSGSVLAQVQQLHLHVSTCAVKPDIVLRTVLTEVDGKAGSGVLSFGPVPVGQRVVKRLEIHNQSSHAVMLRASPLDTREDFSVVNAMRKVAAGATFTTLISFSPTQRAECLEVLTISTRKTRLRIPLKGEGIAPELQLGPEGITTSGLDLGDVFKGDTSEATLSVTNVCPFPLTFTAAVKGSALTDPNMAMKAPFFCRPQGGTLAQGESQSLTVVFQPSSQRPYFQDTLQVLVPNQQEELLVPLRGRCWAEGVYISGPTYPPASEDPFLEAQLLALLPHEPATTAAVNKDAAMPVAPPTPSGKSKAAPAAKPVTPSGGKGGAAAAAAAAASVGALTLAAPRMLTRTFPRPAYLGSSSSATFDVGALKSSLGGSSGEVVLEELTMAAKEAGWSVDGGKLSLAAGDKKSITVRYTAPTTAHPGMAAFFGHPEHITLHLSALLKGGLPAPPTSEGRKVALQFRCLLHPYPAPPGVEVEEEKLTGKAGGKLSSTTKAVGKK